MQSTIVALLSPQPFRFAHISNGDIWENYFGG